MKQREQRLCNIHGITDFVYTSEKRWRCVKCLQEAVQRRRDILKQKAIEYKGGKCEICGYIGVPDVYDFHHRIPETKSFAISKDGYTRSWEAIKNEVDKCSLLCCRCHREVHALMRTGEYKSFNDILTYLRMHRIESQKCISSNITTTHTYEGNKKVVSHKPTKEALLESLIQTKSFCGTAKQFNVSDNAVRKWCVYYGIPRTKNELKTYLSI